MITVDVVQSVTPEQVAEGRELLAAQLGGLDLGDFFALLQRPENRRILERYVKAFNRFDAEMRSIYVALYPERRD